MKPMSESPSSNSESSKFSSAPEITPFSAYFYLISASLFTLFGLIVLIFSSIIGHWWYSLFSLILVGAMAVCVYFFIRRSLYIRITTFGITFLMYLTIFISINVPIPTGIVIAMITLSIVVFYKNYRDTRFPYARQPL